MLLNVFHFFTSPISLPTQPYVLVDTQNLITVPQAPQSNYSLAAGYEILPSSSTTFVPYANQ